jgi:hypothetical protein
MISGSLKRCIEVIISSYLDRRAHARIKNFTMGFFERGTNYKAQRLIDILSRFDPTWGQLMKEFLEENERADRMNSI